MRISCTHFVVRVCALHPFYRQNAVDATLGKNTREGTYYAYFPLRVLFVSGSRYRIFTIKYLVFPI